MLKSIGERTTYHKKNRKCPKCKKPMGWTEGLLSMTGIPDYALGRYACMDCGIIPAAEESRAIRKGRRIAKKDGGALNALDKQLTELPTYIQIGYLRQKQQGVVPDSALEFYEAEATGKQSSTGNKK